MHPAASRISGRRVLIATPDMPLRRALKRAMHLELGLPSDDVGHGGRALEALQNRSFGMAILSTELTGISWTDLVGFIREHRPDTRVLLYTSQPVEEHLEMALEYDVATILSRNGHHPVRDGVEATAALLTEDVFGLERWLGGDGSIFGRQLRSSSEILPLARMISLFFKPEGKDRIFFRVLTEMLTNAVYYGSLGEDGARKAEWAEDVTLERDQGVYVFWGRSERGSGCSILDRGGKLEKRSVLEWLHRQQQQSVGGLTLGNALNHGRGLSITRRSLDRLIINTRRNDRTEIVLLNLPEGVIEKTRPLLIHEF
ncbi:MAG: hypothetical protein RL318_3037 [Fibrobacterota bacterium]